MNIYNASNSPGLSRGTRPVLARSWSKRHRQRRVLVIEPDINQRATLCAWLREAGCEAIGEHDEVSGLSRIALRAETMQPIHGVLMRINLRSVGSRAVLAELRETCPALPVVVMGDSETAEAMREAVQRGAIGQLVTPLDPDAFKTKCRAFFRDPDKPNE